MAEQSLDQAPKQTSYLLYDIRDQGVLLAYIAHLFHLHLVVFGADLGPPVQQLDRHLHPVPLHRLQQSKQQ